MEFILRQIAFGCLGDLNQAREEEKEEKKREEEEEEEEMLAPLLFLPSFWLALPGDR